jgi:hypothetical protein
MEVGSYLVGRAVPQAASHRLPTAYHGGPSSSPAQVMRDLWWTQRHRDTFTPSTSDSSASHSTDRSTLVINHHPRLVRWPFSGPNNYGLGSTPPQQITLLVTS